MNTKNINYNSLRKVHLLSALFFITILFSCKKDGEIIPIFDEGNLDVLFTDTFSITTSVVPEDSLRTDLAVYHLLGLYNDPIYGPKSSSIYTQMTLAGTNVDFGAIPVLDSVILTMTYQGFYGDTSAPMSINVFELTTEMSSSNDYYSNTRISHDITPLATKVFTPNLTDSVDVAFDNTTVAAHLRINLGATFGAKIIAGDINGTGALVDDATFQQYINGLYITTTDSVTNTSIPSGSGGIGYFDMNTTLSTVTVYYNDTSSYAFSINSGSAKYSRFDHNYVGTDVEKQLNNDITRDVNLAYVSTMAGVKTKIELPTIRDLGNGDPVVINKAALTFSVASDKESTVDLVDQTIYLVGIDADGNQLILADDNPAIESDNTHLGGSYYSATGTYTFNITRHIHQLLTTTATDYGMYLVSSGARTEANRVVLGSGEENNAYKIRLEITYSKI